MFLLIAQPAPSTLFETPECQYLQVLFGLAAVTTVMGMFGRIGNDRTKLLTNLPQSGQSLDAHPAWFYLGLLC